MDNKNFYIDIVIENEKIRNQKMQMAYKTRIEELPKGSLYVRKIKGKDYCYLRYREGSKVIQKYVGTIDQIDTIRSKIKEREHLCDLLKMLENEYKKILKMEAIK